MFGNMNLKTKLIISICGIAILSFVVTLTYITINVFKGSRQESLNITMEMSKRYGTAVKLKMDKAAFTAETLSNSISGLMESEKRPERSQIIALLKKVISQNPEFWGAWSTWEANAIDNNDKDFTDTPGNEKTGRFMPYWYRDGGKLVLDVTGAYEEGNEDGKWYWTPMRSGKPYLTPPTVYKIGGRDVMLVSYCVPIKTPEGTLGVVGVDFSMDSMAEIISTIKPYGNGYGSLVTETGLIVAHPEKKTLGKNMKDFGVSSEVISAVKQGKEITEFGRSKLLGTNTFFFYTPISMGSTGNSWSLGVCVSMDKVMANARSLRNTSIIIGIISVMFMFVTVYFLSGNLIVSPINKVVKGLRDIAEGEGDLTKRLEIKSRDEIGTLATWFNTFMDQIHEIISETSTHAGQVGESSTQLQGISGKLNSNADSTSTRSAQVADSAQEMSSGITSVAAAMEQASTNISMVATATEEMTATINEIAGKSESARGVSEKAVLESRTASEKMEALGSAANDIGKVTETISDISEQTNLLALNATIEAARAGEAGKGFAVVANEIKALSGQTAEATREIRERIEGIQSVTKDSVTAIENVSKIIGEINDIIATVAAAVEQQSAATSEIATNISQASEGVQHVNVNVNQASVLAETISGDIGLVNEETAEISSNSRDVSSNADELAELSKQLRSMVNRFKV